MFLRLLATKRAVLDCSIAVLGERLREAMVWSCRMGMWRMVDACVELAALFTCWVALGREHTLRYRSLAKELDHGLPML